MLIPAQLCWFITYVRNLWTLTDLCEVSMFYGSFPERQYRKRLSAPHAHWLCWHQACRQLAKSRHAFRRFCKRGRDLRAWIQKWLQGSVWLLTSTSSTHRHHVVKRWNYFSCIGRFSNKISVRKFRTQPVWEGYSCAVEADCSQPEREK